MEFDGRFLDFVPFPLDKFSFLFTLQYRGAFSFVHTFSFVKQQFPMLR